MIARLPLSPLAALFFSALVFPFSYSAFAAPVPKHDVLHLKLSCPPTEALCLGAELIWTEDGWGRVTFKVHGNPIYDGATITQDIVVRGRLDGGEPRIFVLRTEHPIDDFTNRVNDLGQVAFFGRSHADRPIVLTDRGRVEILTKSVDVSYGARIVMLDDRTWKVAANFLSFQSLIISSASEIGIWDARSKSCIEAPTEHSGALRFSSTACRGRLNGKSYVLDRIAGDIAPAAIPLARLKPIYTEVWGLEGGRTPNDDLAKSFSEFGGGGNGYSVYRVGKSHMLIVTIDHDPC